MAGQMALRDAQNIAVFVAENPDGAKLKYSDWEIAEAALVILVRNRLLSEPTYEVTRVED